MVNISSEQFAELDRLGWSTVEEFETGLSKVAVSEDEGVLTATYFSNDGEALASYQINDQGLSERVEDAALVA